MVRKFVRYILVGILNTLFGYSLYALFIYAGMHYSLAVLVSTVLGVLFNFKTIGKLVFKSNDDALIFRFFAVYAITYLLNVYGLKVFHRYDYNMYLAGLLMLIPSTVVSFILHSKFVFRKKVV